ncbi:MAG: hypothetical protein AAF989_01725, partial [Planctomycetota bacterium]
MSPDSKQQNVQNPSSGPSSTGIEGASPSLAAGLPMTSAVQRCCDSAVWLKRLAFGGAASALVLAAFVLGRMSDDRSFDPEEAAGQSVPAWKVAGMPTIDATASASSEDYSIATGPVSDRAEGLFVLDHNSGVLQCNVVYPRVGQFMASFTTNITEAMGTGGKGGQYIMTTGTANFQGAANQQLAPSVLYVLDTSTGNFACFAVPFNRVAMNARKPQQGTMVL